MASAWRGIAALPHDLIGALQEGVVLTDADGVVREVNDEATRILRSSAEELLGRPLTRDDAVDPDYRVIRADEQPLAVARRTGATVTAVIGRRMGPNDILWLRTTAAPVESPDPVHGGTTVSGVLSTFVDVTERVQDQQALRASEERFRLTFRDAPIGMAIVTLEGRFEQVNSAMCTLLGYSEKDLLALTFQEITHPDDLESDLENIAALLLGTVNLYQMQKRYFRRDGTVVSTRLTVSLVHDAHQDPLHFVSQLEDITELLTAQRLLERRALYDHLTGLPNRSLLLERLTLALGRAAARGTKVAVAYVDLDHFKRVNDSLGHDAGDTLLATVGTMMRTALRPGDTVARIGGDEFVLLLEDVDTLEEAQAIVARVVEEVQRPVGIGGHTVVPSMSAGLTVDDGGSSPETILREADTALYVAKESGRSRCEVYDEDVRVRALAQLSLEEELRVAVEQRSFVLHYQPIVELRTGSVIAYEALVRWVHPRRGLVLPGEFISVAEDANLIRALGSWVLTEVCQFVARHPEFTGQVFANVSPFQLGTETLVGDVRSALTGAGVPASRLGIEITETAVLDATGSTLGELEQLASMGTVLVLDDFGTGYSALTSVLSGAVSGLKLDRSFTSRLGDGGAGDRISVAIAALVDSLGRYGVVEGIETAEQRSHALLHGWVHGQGWLFGRPAPEEALTFDATVPAPPPGTGCR